MTTLSTILLETLCASQVLRTPCFHRALHRLLLMLWKYYGSWVYFVFELRPFEDREQVSLVYICVLNTDDRDLHLTSAVFVD